MIEKYNKITVKYLKSNKKRSILTIVAIILSVALISSIGIFFNGIMMAQEKQAILDYGDYYLKYKTASSDIVSKIKNDNRVLKYGFVKGLKLEGKDNLKLSGIIVKEKYDRMLPLKYKEGRSPEKEDEIAVMQATLKMLANNSSIGDYISLGNKKYKLVGVLENRYLAIGEYRTDFVTYDNKISESDSQLFVRLKDGVNLKKAMPYFLSLDKEKKVELNKKLLACKGYASDTRYNGVYVVVSIVISIVVIATIFVIYNAFQISVVDRIKQFGLLRTVGATPKQIRRIILREAGLLSLIAIPIGLFFGVMAIVILNFIIKNLVGNTLDNIFILQNVISFKILIISGVIGLISVYMSAYLPAYFAGKVSPLEAISSRNSIRKEKIKRRKNFIFTKIFGFEGSLAIKNIKRQPRRYRITILSIIISIVMFVTFRYLFYLNSTLTNSSNNAYPVHFLIEASEKAQNNMDEKESDSIITKLNTIGNIKEVHKRYEGIWLDTIMNKSSEVDEIKDSEQVYKKIKGNENQVKLMSIINIYDAADMEKCKKYLVAGKLEDLNQENAVVLIGKNIVTLSGMKSYSGKITKLGINDEVEFAQSSTGGEVKNNKLMKAKIVAILSEDPFDGYSNVLTFISNKAFANKVKENIGYHAQKGTEGAGGAGSAKNANENLGVNVTGIKITLKDISKADNTESNIEGIINENRNLKLTNNAYSMQKTANFNLIIQILFYGFIVVISLIGSLNIINTVTTNIILRRREFASLKAIGLTNKGLKKVIGLEGIAYGIMGGFYGVLVSLGICYIMYRASLDIRQTQFVPPISSIVIAVTVAIVICILSVIYPLRKVKGDNLIDAIRDEA